MVRSIHINSFIERRLTPLTLFYYYMERYILLEDLPKPGYKRGAEILFPDDEISVLIKGKGYFIQIYKESEIITKKLPDKLIIPHEYTSGYVKKSRDDWNVYDIVPPEECKEGHPYGTYVKKVFVGEETTKSCVYYNYETLKSFSTRCIPIDLEEEKSIIAGDLIVRIYEDGVRIPGLARNSKIIIDPIDVSHEFLIFLPLVSNDFYGVSADRSYSKGSGNFFYQKMKKDELTDIIMSRINYILTHPSFDTTSSSVLLEKTLKSTLIEFNSELMALTAKKRDEKG